MSSTATSATSGGAYGKTIPPSKNASSLARPRDEANLLDEADMWATVCDILHTSPVEPQRRDDLDVYTCHSVSSYQDPCLPKPKRIRVYTNKAEVQQLEAEISDLQAQLMAAKQTAMSSCSNKVPSMWARAAARQRLDKNKCLDENQQLQAAVAERSKHIQRLQKLILKTPRWTSLPEVTDESACLGRQLPADPALRLAAIHRLADRHLQRFHTAFIQAGALDLTHDMCRGDSIALAQDQIGFQSINHINLPAPYRSIADACWRVLSGRLSTEEEIHTRPRGDVQVWEHVDEHTVYERYRSRHHTGRHSFFHGNEIRKYHVTTEHIVIAWVSVVDDALVTLHPSDSIDEVWGW
ncbi:hypothetical protein, variant [Aphanomyces astaci]|nr:hypothetical protein, variant [Aphanomyces astaci]ETV78520.1 hypothetical protein, variant [Aphanomyces astaci]|eukprot:XP_009832100.1 hypothetical protein, variant [Aphanomyces astaci]